MDHGAQAEGVGGAQCVTPHSAGSRGGGTRLGKVCAHGGAASPQMGRGSAEQTQHPGVTLRHIPCMTLGSSCAFE